MSCLLDARLGTLSNRSNSLVSGALGVPASLSHPMLFGVLSWGGVLYPASPPISATGSDQHIRSHMFPVQTDQKRFSSDRYRAV